MISQTVGRSTYHVLTRRPLDWKLKESSVGTNSTEFLKAGGRPLGYQRETVGKPISVRVSLQ